MNSVIDNHGHRDHAVSLTQLATVEIQLIMQGLCSLDLLRLSSCCQYMRHAACHSFVWKNSNELQIKRGKISKLTKRINSIICCIKTSPLCFAPLRITLSKQLIENQSDELRELVNVIKHGYKHESLRVTGLECIDNNLNDEQVIILTDLIKCSKNITSIQLEDNSIGSIGGALSLSDAITQNQNLTSINISTCELGDEAIKALSKSIMENKNLTNLNLSFNEFTNEGALALSRALTYDESKITDLDISGNLFENESITFLENALKQNKTITKLNLRCIGSLENTTIHAISDFIEHNQSLYSIDLGYNNIDDRSAVILSKAIKSANNLADISFCFNSIKYMGICALAESIKCNKNLTSIDFSMGNFGPKGLIALAESIKQNESITYVNLRHQENKMTNFTSISHLSDAIKNLTSIDLSGNGILESGATVLANVIKKSHRLTSIFLTDNHIGYRGALSLVHAARQNASILEMTLDEIYNDVYLHSKKSSHMRKLSTHFNYFYCSLFEFVIFTSQTHYHLCNLQMTITSLPLIIEFLKSRVHRETDTGVRCDPLLIGSRALQLNIPFADANKSITISNQTDWDILATIKWTIDILSLKTVSEQVLSCELRTFGGEEENVYQLVIRTRIGYKLDIEMCPEAQKVMFKESLFHNSGSLLLPLGSYRDQIYCNVASLEVLEAIKTSHISWPSEFTKHITHLHMIRSFLSVDDTLELQQRSFSRSEDMQAIVDTRRSIKEKIHGLPGKDINLNQSSEDFLEKNNKLLVERLIAHDDLHKLVALGAEPQYIKMLVSPEKALCSEAKWNDFTFQEKLNDIMEEAMVIAMERYLLPNRLTDQNEAYRLAVIRICTTLARGFFAKAAIDYYPLISKCPRDLVQLANKIRSDYKAKVVAENLASSKLIDSSENPEEMRLKKYRSTNVLPKSEKHKWIRGMRIYKLSPDFRTSDKWQCNPINDKKFPFCINNRRDNFVRLDSRMTPCDAGEESCMCDCPVTYGRWSDIIFGDVTMIQSRRGHLICVWSIYEDSYYDCSETHSWAGYVVIIPHVKNQNFTTMRKVAYESILDNPNGGYFENTDYTAFEFISRNEKGGSYGGAGDIVKVNYYSFEDSKTTTPTNHEENLFLLQYACAVVNPEMEYGGERMLKNHISELSISGGGGPSFNNQHLWVQTLACDKEVGKLLSTALQKQNISF